MWVRRAAVGSVALLVAVLAVVVAGLPSREAVETDVTAQRAAPMAVGTEPPQSARARGADPVAPPSGLPAVHTAQRPLAPDAAAHVPDARARQVVELLDRRAAALLARDRHGFLEGIDPAAIAFRERQAAVFDALAEVPLGMWEYELDAGRASDAAGLAVRYGTDVWVPQVTLRYSFAGVGTSPSVAAQVLTFVRRGATWLIASDADLDGGPVVTARSLWDSGPVVAVRGRHALVLGHPGRRAALEELARDVDAAVPRVTAVWGSDWAQQVVVMLPDDVEEMRRLVGHDLELGPIAAVATAQLVGGDDRYEPVGDRVVVHPDNYPGLGALGRRIVLTHEVLHVAARRASGPALPAWLAEGLADYVAYAGTGVPVERAAPRTAADVRLGRVPEGLPDPEDFTGEGIAGAYELSWLAAVHLAERHGEDALLRLYRTIGAAPLGEDGDAVVAQAFTDVLATSPEEFAAGWRASIASRFP